ncbi:MAG: tetratricopeptide repeat protein [Sphaerospermopsis sp. SIO1G1]|nr:tetratricopeptide repeat protein [Sphaerospermopsis sp. SIO1G1]
MNIWGAEQQKILDVLESTTKQESPGILKAGNPSKSLANWTGRTEEIADLKQWLNNPNIPLIGIEGIGGTGKSMLATKIYEDEEITGFKKRFWADVSYGAVFTDVATQVLQEFGFAVPNNEQDLLPTLIQYLKENEILLIIDNVESLLTQKRAWGSQFYQDFFNTWVEFGSKSKVIITTRERPKIPKFQWLNLGGLKVEDGVALLKELGITGNLTEFVELVDGYPLLLKFVADLLIEEYPQDPDLKRLTSLGLGNLQQLLTDEKVVGVHRRENVGMVLVLDASFGRLSDLQKSLLLNISIYRAAVNSHGASFVCSDISQSEIETELRNLVRRSFLSEKLIDDHRYYQFQPVILEYVRYQAGNQTELHHQAINYYRSIAQESGWQTKEDIQEYLEIFYHFYQLEDYDLAFETIRHCDNFLTLRGYYANRVELYGQLVSKWSRTNDKENWHYTASLTSLGNAYQSLGQYQKAIEYHQQSLDIAREIGDVRRESSSLNNLGNAYDSLGEYQKAISFHYESLEITREIGDIEGESSSLNNLGLAYDSLGEYQKAISFHQQSLNIAKEIGDIRGESYSLNNLGLVYDSLGQYQKAIAFYQQSLDIKREIGDIGGESNSLNNLGNAYKAMGNYKQAIDKFRESLKICNETKNIRMQAENWFDIGETLEKVNRQSDAIKAYKNSQQLYTRVGIDFKIKDCQDAIVRLS